MKKILSTIVTTALISSCTISVIASTATVQAENFGDDTTINTASVSNDITVQLDGMELSFDVQPQLINDRIMLPIREIFESMGAVVSWDETAKMATAVARNGTVVQMTENSNIVGYKPSIYKDFDSPYWIYQIDTPVVNVNGRILAPMRVVANSLGYAVNWNQNQKIAYIETPSKTINSEYYSGTIVPNFEYITNTHFVDKTFYVGLEGNISYRYESTYLDTAEFAIDAYTKHLELNGWKKDKHTLMGDGDFTDVYIKDDTQLNVSLMKNFSSTSSSPQTNQISIIVIPLYPAAVMQ